MFVTDLQSEVSDWDRALSPYVVQGKKVEAKYTFLDKLGRGSFGYVILAEKIIEK